MTLRLGLCGLDIAHSLSPKLHRTAGELAGIAVDYQLFPGDAAELQRRIEQLRQGQLGGLNVTTPHKRLADGNQSVNTLWMQNGQLQSASTDGEGFAWALTHAVTGQRALVLGAGGAAQAIVKTLKQLGAQVFVTARQLSQARSIGEAIAWGDTHAAQDFDLIVHATLLGHAGRPLAGELDWLPWQNWRIKTQLFDVVYAQGLTQVQQFAQNQGVSVLADSGLKMLAGQAAESFRLWTGAKIDAYQLYMSVASGKG